MNVIFNNDNIDYESILDIVDLCVRSGFARAVDLIDLLGNLNLAFAFKIKKIWPHFDLRIEFVIYVLLLERLKENVDLPYLISRDWEEDVAQQLLRRLE